VQHADAGQGAASGSVTNGSHGLARPGWASPGSGRPAEYPGRAMGLQAEQVSSSVLQEVWSATET
jgi:hypothetical protein